METEPDLPGEPDQLQADVDEVIAACGGDMRAAIAALLVANSYLEHELELARGAVSSGYARGWFARRDGA